MGDIYAEIILCNTVIGFLMRQNDTDEIEAHET